MHVMMNCMVVMPFHHSSQEKDETYVHKNKGKKPKAESNASDYDDANFSHGSMQYVNETAGENEEIQFKIEQNHKRKKCLQMKDIVQQSKKCEIGFQLVLHFLVNSIFIIVEQINGGTELKSWVFVYLPYLIGLLPLWWYYSIYHLRKWATKSERVELDNDEVNAILGRNNRRICLVMKHEKKRHNNAY